MTWRRYLLANGFPFVEWQSRCVTFERWCELARWHERLRAEWAGIAD